MNFTKKLLFAAVASGVLLLSSSLLAQQVVSKTGLIGKRYVGVDFTYDHFRSSIVDDGFGGSASVSYNQIKHATDSMTYTIGLRWAF